jgi:RNA polymerase sigma factor (sigma-70 family)
MFCVLPNADARPTANPEAPETFQAVEHLFREEAGKMVALLTGIFGIQHLTLAEDVVQEALARALQTWPYYGVPRNPSAWILRTARNLALDVLRRQKIFREKEPEIIRVFEREAARPDEAVFTEIADDRLRLMFVCCHPAVPAEAQAALALNTLCGFGVAEIAHAFLVSEAALAKRLVRAKQKIRQAKIPFEIPAGPELAQRLEGVLQTVYLLFNEGYKASAGDKLIREDICLEAIRLGAMLAQHRAGNYPGTHALLALMLLNAARAPARVDEQGHLLLLKEQDRSRWDPAMIARGMYHFGRSAEGQALSRYHLQAAIAACHCSARDYSSTDWPKILLLYDRLRELDDSPVIALNRAVALAEVHGPAAGLAALEPIANRPELQKYYLFYAVRGELEAHSKNMAQAAAAYRKALELAQIKTERTFLERRLRACEESAVPVS